MAGDIVDHVKHKLRKTKDIKLSFDEWNVWYLDRYQNDDKLTGIDNWPVAPRLLEDSYSVADAVVVGNLLISLLKHADRVTSASLAQLVNVIAPIMTSPGGSAWKQTTFHPFAQASRYAAGDVLRVEATSPSHDTKEYGEVPLLHAVATHSGDETVIFAVNRSTDEPLSLEIDARSLGDVRVVEATTLSGPDVYARNTAEAPDTVAPRPNPDVQHDPLSVLLPPVSWNVIRLG